MRWIDTVVLFNSLAAGIIGALLLLTIRKKEKRASELALLCLFGSQFAWIVSDTSASALGVHFGILSGIHGGITGLSIIAMVISAYVFCETYPSPQSHVPYIRFRIFLLGLSALPFTFLAFTDYWVSNRRVENGVKLGDPEFGFILMGLWAALAVLVGLGVLQLKNKRLRDSRIKKNIRLLTLAFLFNLFLPLFASWLLPLLEVPEFDFIGPFSSIVFTSVVLYGINFHRLLDMETATLTSLINLISALVIGAAVFALIYYPLRVAESASPALIWPALSVLFLLGMAYARWFRPRLDRLLFRHQAPTRDLLSHLLSGRAFDLRNMTLHRLLNEILKALSETFGISRALILTAESFERTVIVEQGESPGAALRRELRLLSRLGSRQLSNRFLREFDGVFLLERESSSPLGPWFENPTALLKRYPRLGASLAGLLNQLKLGDMPVFMPLILNKQILGYIFLGEKAGGKPYYRTDLELLENARMSVSLALRNYTYYNEIKLMQNRAEAEVKKLTEFIAGKETISRIIHGRTLLYASPVMDRVLKKSREAARAGGQPALILGETGTGKELIARLIHDEERPEKPFVAVNCAAIPASLWEDDIFGHLKGAFTDARTDRQGKVALAADGTLFFDEIGEMPPEMQAKMLRLLQERIFTPIGGDKPQPVKCRFIFATNRNLEDMITRGEFRQDLYYRINVFEVSIPALRKRRQDIPLLVKHFTEKFAAELNSPVKSIARDAMDSLERYNWPGNIRELENVLIRALAGASGEALLKEDLPVSFGQTQNTMGKESALEKSFSGEDDLELEGNLNELLNDYRKLLVSRAIKKARGNKTRAAELLGIKRTTLYSHLKELKVNSD